MADFPVALTNAQDGPPGVGTPLMAKHLNNLEAKVGIDASAVPTSLDYLLRNPASIEPGHKHSKLWSPDGSLQALTVDAAGNVGIGTASPAVQLEITKTLRALAGAEQVPASGKGLELKYDSGPDEGVLISYDRTGGAWKPIRLRGSLVALESSGAEVLRITGGKVGIGTTAPDVKLSLQISDTSTVAAWPGTWQAQAYDALALYNQSGAAQITALFFRNYNTGDGVAYHAGRIALLRRGSGSADFAFMLRNGGSIYNEVLRLTGPGNVGIGTTSPGYSLEVYNGYICVNDAVDGGSYGFRMKRAGVEYGTLKATAQGFAFTSMNSKNVYLTTDGGHINAVPGGSGKFGIGTGTPGKLLDVNGYIRGIGIFNTLNAAPADGDLTAGECALWFDKTDGAAKLMIKAKQNNGTVKTGSVSLS